MNWTLTRACGEFGVSRETIARGLRGIGEEMPSGRTYPTRLIHRALTGDGKFERARLTRAQADREEIEVAKLRREVLPLSDVLALVRLTFGPIRDGLVSLPQSVAARANPGDPPMAMAAIRDAVDNILRGLREESLPTIIDSVMAQKPKRERVKPEKRGKK